MRQEGAGRGCRPNRCRVRLWRRPNYSNSLCHLITRLYSSVPKRCCSALLLKVLIYVSTPFLFDREVKMTLCMIYCKSLGCGAILFGAVWVLCWRAEQKYWVSLITSDRHSGLLPNLFQCTTHVTHRGSFGLTWAHLWILPSCKIKKPYSTLFYSTIKL